MNFFTISFGIDLGFCYFWRILFSLQTFDNEKFQTYTCQLEEWPSSLPHPLPLDLTKGHILPRLLRHFIVFVVVVFDEPFESTSQI